MHIGKRLKEMRRRSGQSQEQVSQGIISSSHYSNIEGGRFEPSQDILYLLADRLSVPYTYFEDVHVDDPKLAVLLSKYEKLIEGGDQQETKTFFHENESKFEFIPSMNQELLFSLLRILDLVNFDQFDEVERLYISKVKGYIDPDEVYMLSAAIQEKYYYVTGLIHYVKKHYPESIKHFNKTISLTKDANLEARLTFNVALSLFRIYDYHESLKYSLKAKDLYLNLHNWIKTADCYNLIAVLYREVKNYDQAEVYIKKGLDILDESEMTYAVLLQNLASLRIEQNITEEALELLIRSINLKKKHNHQNLSVSYRTKLEIYIKKGDFASLKEELLVTKSYSVTAFDEAHVQVIEGKLKLYEEKYNEYESLMNNCINFFYDNQDWKSMVNISGDLSRYYAERKQYKKAYQIIQKELHATKIMYKGM